MSIKIQIFSDLHTEYYSNLSDLFKFSKIDVSMANSTDFLILAGDIGDCEKPIFLKFIDFVAKNWKQIIYVPGNHEFYSKTQSIDQKKLQYKNIFTSYKNIHYLNDQHTDISMYSGSSLYHIRFIGSILWSNPLHTKDRWDFKEIKTRDKNNKLINLPVSTFKNMHFESLNYLKSKISESSNSNIDNFEIDNNDGKTNNFNSNTTVIHRTVVITHFPPISDGTIHPKFKDSIYKTYFTNELKELNIDVNNVDIWISGHTHYSYNIKLANKKTLFISNQLGYPDEDLNANFDPKMIVSLS